MSVRRVVVGLDLSLRAAAAARVTLPWDGDLEDVTTCVVGEEVAVGSEPEAYARRLDRISKRIADFCDGADAVYVEEYAFSQMSKRAHSLGELGGVVKVDLYRRTGKSPTPVTASTARKTMLQKLPRAGVKAYTMRNVRRLGPPADKWTEDQIDAFVCMNHGVMLQGGIALTFVGE